MIISEMFIKPCPSHVCPGKYALLRSATMRCPPPPAGLPPSVWLGFATRITVPTDAVVSQVAWESRASCGAPCVEQRGSGGGAASDPLSALYECMCNMPSPNSQLSFVGTADCVDVCAGAMAPQEAVDGNNNKICGGS